MVQVSGETLGNLWKLVNVMRKPLQQSMHTMVASEIPSNMKTYKYESVHPSSIVSFCEKLHEAFDSEQGKQRFADGPVCIVGNSDESWDSVPNGSKTLDINENHIDVLGGFLRAVNDWSAKGLQVIGQILD